MRNVSVFVSVSVSVTTVTVLVSVLLSSVELVTAKCKKKVDYSGSIHGEDSLLRIASQWRKEGRLGQAPDIPALTDRSFDSTVYRCPGHCGMTVVLFYLPFDAQGMLFLDQYQQAGRELASSGTGDNSSSTSSPSHPLRRVNCHDWTDVCQRENITHFPTIHLYQDGKWRQQYRDALDKDVLVRAVSLWQAGQPLWLRSREEVEKLVNWDLPDTVQTSVDNLVILKPSASLYEVTAFTEVVRQLGTRMLFAIVSPGVDTRLGVEVGVLHARRGDKYRPYDTLVSPLDADSILRFILSTKHGMLPELTFLNFPELYGLGHPFAILFLNPWEDQSSGHVHPVVDVINSKSVHNVTFCTMTVDEDENPMAGVLLRNYTGQRDTPAFVYLDLRQGTVFVFTKWPLTERKLRVWLWAAQQGKITVTNHLRKNQWRPKGQHIDFLRKIENDKKKKKRRAGKCPLQTDPDDDVDDDDTSVLLASEDDEHDLNRHSYERDVNMAYQFSTSEFEDLDDSEGEQRKSLLASKAKRDSSRRSSPKFSEEETGMESEDPSGPHDEL